MLTRSRPRRNRNRFVQIGLFIIVYTCYYALSASIIPSEIPISEGDFSTDVYSTVKVEVDFLLFIKLYVLSNEIISTSSNCNIGFN